MLGFDNLDIVESVPMRHIKTNLHCDMIGIHQGLTDVALDTGCNRSLIPAQLLNFGMSRDKALDILMVSTNVPVEVSLGVEGTLEDTSDIMKLMRRLNDYKFKCKNKGYTLDQARAYINKNMTLDELNRIRNSKFIKFRIQVSNLTVGCINIGTGVLSVAFNLKCNTVLLGMETLQYLYIQTFRFKQKQYTLLALRSDKECIRKAVQLSNLWLGYER